jgi:AraC-like DNA-binding protein
LPARQISRAVNRIQKRNVSQFVNDIRVREACRLLKESSLSITQVIYECGFQTKSNFNREFLRVTGKTPRQWRTEAALK